MGILQVTGTMHKDNGCLIFYRGVRLIEPSVHLGTIFGLESDDFRIFPILGFKLLDGRLGTLYCFGLFFGTHRVLL